MTVCVSILGYDIFFHLFHVIPLFAYYGFFSLYVIIYKIPDHCFISFLVYSQSFSFDSDRYIFALDSVLSLTW